MPLVPQLIFVKDSRQMTSEVSQSSLRSQLFLPSTIGISSTDVEPIQLDSYVLDRLVSGVSGSGGGDAGSRNDKNSNGCRCIPKL
jgi:hypothetical protein